MNNIYLQKVELLLKILPFVTDEECFAIHGGTAINLFVKNLYRLSVDIDVTYIPIEDRDASFSHINDALLRIAGRVERSYFTYELDLTVGDNYIPITVKDKRGNVTEYSYNIKMVPVEKSNPEVNINNNINVGN